jgi:hypothetical protein
VVGAVDSLAGRDLALTGKGRFFQQPIAGLPPTTNAVTYQIGDTLRSTTGDIYLCYAAGAPGTWRKVAAGAPGFQNASGSTNLLAKPIRIFDSRVGSGAPLPTTKALLQPNTDTDIQVTGTPVDGLAVPFGAKALIGNLTVTNEAGPGFLRMFPTGTTPLPVVSVINYQAGVDLANGVVMSLNATGQVTIHCDISATHAILDVTGFVF